MVATTSVCVSLKTHKNFVKFKNTEQELKKLSVIYTHTKKTLNMKKLIVVKY